MSGPTLWVKCSECGVASASSGHFQPGHLSTCSGAQPGNYSGATTTQEPT